MVGFTERKSKRQLVVLGCSDRKLEVDGTLPAVSMYDGPMYRVLRNYLRDHHWPNSLSIAVLSAKYGLIGGISPIEFYNQRMTADRARELSGNVTETLLNWGLSHDRVDFVLGKDYAATIDEPVLRESYKSCEVVPGGIGLKQQQFRDLLYSASRQSPRRCDRELKRKTRPLYFLPDWDDFIDESYDYENDQFSSPTRADRREKHTIQLMRPSRMCDGVLVSLAQNLGTKGLLKRVEATDAESLHPKSVKSHFGLKENQWAFGDCGAFSYVAEPEPTISVEQAVALYDLYDFDLGASVDHIPVAALPSENGMVAQSDYSRRRRVSLTRGNAADFISEHSRRKARFVPIGVVQGLGAKSYANQIGDYLDMGYTHIALGGLVPRRDSDIEAIVQAVHKELKRHKRQPWVHLLGVFRPRLQELFRELGIASFDSATYFRKAWLRSDQNYLGRNGEWYAAIRVPPSGDPRVLKRLKQSNVSHSKIKRLEEASLCGLRDYARGAATLDDVLAVVMEYDRLLARAEDLDSRLLDSYRRTLLAKPWTSCHCSMCKKLGIDVLIFRGKNRNKSRGAHNTLMLYEMLGTRK
ncbi:MAG: hypothetical protein KDA69_12965 [Planctomycetaceae bacterium]|nr:hypothetical protein [Planctomycetaceae bacterium]